MKNFFSKMFGKENNEEKVLTFKVLDEIYSYLYYENPSLDFKMKGFFDKVYINRYNFPESFDNPKSKSEIKSCGLSSIYEVLNQIYPKINVEPISKDLIDENYPVDFIHIQFYSDGKNYNSAVKNILQNFIIFFSCENGSTVSNGFRLWYCNNRYFTFYIRNLLDSKHLDLTMPLEDHEKIAIDDFKKVVTGICQHLKIDSGIEAPNLLVEAVSQSHYFDLLLLISRNAIPEKELTKQAGKLFKAHQKHGVMLDILESNESFMDNINCWNSDWKFDPEDAEYFISEMIGKTFTFERPEETYSHDLFPYIQTELAKNDFELMSFNTYGDSYLFFVANKTDVAKILELSEITNLEIDRLV